jgi:hypothetical protein
MQLLLRLKTEIHPLGAMHHLTHYRLLMVDDVQKFSSDKPRKGPNRKWQISHR